ncbi:hypothetical protein Gotur_009588 [Gossypium turneri]
MATGELACTYAALILHDDGISITAEKIATLVKAANLSVESYWPSLFAKLLEKVNVDDLITSVGSGGGAAPVAVAAASGAAGGAAAAAAPAVEEKKEEEKEESDDDMGFSLTFAEIQEVTWLILLGLIDIAIEIVLCFNEVNVDAFICIMVIVFAVLLHILMILKHSENSGHIYRSHGDWDKIMVLIFVLCLLFHIVVFNDCRILSLEYLYGSNAQ